MKMHILPLIASAALAIPAQAADEPIPAPRIEGGLNEPSVWGRLSIVSRMDRREVGEADAPLRQAMLMVAPENWFTNKSALIKAYLAAPDKPLQATIAVTIGAQGRISQCEFGKSAVENVLPLDLKALCADLRKGALYAPALDQAGKPTESSAVITFFSSTSPIHFENRPVGLIIARGLAEPPAPPRRIVTPSSLTQFPPSPAWVRSQRPPTSYQQSVIWRSGDTDWNDSWNDKGRLVGVLYNGEDVADAKDARCSIIMSSQNAATDAEACRFISEVVKPEWDDLPATKPRKVALLVNVDGTKTRAVAASEEARQPADLVYEKGKDLQNAISAETGISATGPGQHFTMMLRLDQTGQATHCQIVVSSGSDAGDIASCKIAREGIWYTPERDVFGRPAAGAIIIWYPH